MHQGAAGGTHMYPTFFTSQLLGLLQEKENRCSRDFLTSQTQQLSGRSNHAFSGTSVVARASDRPPAGGSRERIDPAARSPSSREQEGDPPCVAVRTAGSQARERTAAPGCPCRRGTADGAEATPTCVAPRGCLRLTVTHVTPSRSSVLPSWLRRLTRLCLPKGKKRYICFEQ